jgi:transcriptional regulator with XRE-family HTH domain
VRLGLRQVDVAARARVSRSFVSNLERGLSRSTDVARIEAVCAALGADLDVRIRWRGEGLDRLLDEAHATIVDRIVRLLEPSGWKLWLEVTFNHYGDRGSIDVLGWHPESKSLLVVEIKSVVPDAQGTIAPLDRKVRIAPIVARERGIEARSVSRLLVVGDTTTNRRRVARFEALFSAALPDRGRAVRQWLSMPAGSISGLLYVPDSTGDGIRRTAAGRTRVSRPKKSQHACQMTPRGDIRGDLAARGLGPGAVLGPNATPDGIRQDGTGPPASSHRQRHR